MCSMRLVTHVDWRPSDQPPTLQSLGKRGNTSCQHALFFLRWLDRTPESFLSGAAVDAGAPLPACGPDRRPRWDLKALHGGLNERGPAAASPGRKPRRSCAARPVS